MSKIQFRSLRAQTSEIGRQKFLRTKYKKMHFHDKGFFYSKVILKVSCKNIEKWLSYNEFVGIDYAHVAN